MTKLRESSLSLDAGEPKKKRDWQFYFLRFWSHHLLILTQTLTGGGGWTSKSEVKSPFSAHAELIMRIEIDLISVILGLKNVVAWKENVIWIEPHPPFSNNFSVAPPFLTLLVSCPYLPVTWPIRMISDSSIIFGIDFKGFSKIGRQK